MKALGRHILVEFFECSAAILNDVHSIETAMVSAAEKAQATVINSTFHHFSPYGVSGVVVIQESHLAIHTWPEYRYAAVDIFTCGDQVNPWVAYDVLKTSFEAEQGSAIEIQRGQVDLLKRIKLDITGERKEKERDIQFKRNVWFTDKDDNIALSFRHTGELLFRKKSDYQMVQILDTYKFGKMLTIDNIIMTTEKDEFAYHELISHVPMQLHPNPKNILVIGGGDGGTIREVSRYDNVDKITMVEIDEVVVEASKKHLPTIASAFDHPKVQLLIYDGIKYLENAISEAYDVIIIDGSDPKGPSEGLFSPSFYKNVYRCLKPNGILTLQSEGPHFSTDAFIDLNQCLKDIFGKDKVHVYLGYIPTYPTGMWSFNYACKGDIHPYEQLDTKKADAFAKSNKLKYYHAQMHKAAFALPTFVKEMLGD